jgi:hypothetical protein
VDQPDKPMLGVTIPEGKLAGDEFEFELTERRLNDSTVKMYTFTMHEGFDGERCVGELRRCRLRNKLAAFSGKPAENAWYSVRTGGETPASTETSFFPYVDRNNVTQCQQQPNAILGGPF